MWKKLDGSESTLYAEFVVSELTPYLYTSISMDREMPLYIGGPTVFEQETILDLPEEWSFTPGEESIKGKDFAYNSSFSKISDTHIQLNYRYELFNEYVEIEEIKDFLEAQEKIKKDLTFGLTKNTAFNIFKLSWISLLLILITTVIGTVVARNFYLNYDPQPHPYYAGKRTIPIGGWLILIAIGLSLTPLRILFEFITEPNFFNHNLILGILSSNEPTYNPELAFLIGFEIVFNVLSVIFSVLLIILLYQKRTSFPKIIIVFYIVTLIFFAIDVFLVFFFLDDAFSSQEMASSLGEVFRAFISTSIWVPYFIMSERVKKTFIVRRNSSEKELPVENVIA